MLTKGTNTTFANGDSTGTVPKTGKVMGIVAACASNVSESVSTSPWGQRRGRSASIHDCTRRPNMTSARTDATESWKPRENTHAGETSTSTSAARPIDANPCDRLPATAASNPTADMTKARSAESWNPVRHT